jgi:ABC-2 type transport system ATP-binding protein
MLEARDLAKSYGNVAAVRGVSFAVRPGQIVGLLGPNGAGKSTMVSMLCGLTAPDGGTVCVGGEPVGDEASAVKRRIGLVPQDIALFEDLSARENLRLFAALYGVPAAGTPARCDAALERVGLADRAREKPATFSGGMKRRLNIACALVHDPDVLLLDEPTVGVDPQSRNAIFERLEALRTQGKAIVYTTHYMEEAERLCDHIMVIDHGAVAASGTKDALRAMLPTAARRVEIEGAIDDATVASLRARGLSVRETGRATLEDVFLHLTGRQLRD